MTNIDDDRLLRLALAHEREYGHLPNVWELMMLIEADASVQLDRDERVGTYAL